ncbi:protein of unknown function [Azospirillum lipoferum 4B]|uniref:Uncharacterized protein n=1 Tax=Azospirillum lipoferum (strain 4B) TaxID=862719 RepID=G7Z303_AZOL4|nr:protein of unknown function [Azospirillum lipoferum 4B]
MLAKSSHRPYLSGVGRRPAPRKHAQAPDRPPPDGSAPTRRGARKPGRSLLARPPFW